MNSETGSLSPSPLIEPMISSFSTIGKNSCTNSGEYGCVIVSRTWKKSCVELLKKSLIFVKTYKSINNIYLGYKIPNERGVCVAFLTALFNVLDNWYHTTSCQQIYHTIQQHFSQFQLEMI